MSKKTNIFTLKNKIIFKDYESDESISSEEEKKYYVEDNISKNSSKNNSVSLQMPDKFDESSEYDESEESVSKNYESEKIKVYQLIKHEYHNFKKQFRKNQIYYFIQILNIEEKEILDFCECFIYEEYYQKYFGKENYSEYLGTDLFFYLDSAFGMSDLLIKGIKIISSYKKFYVEYMFTFILKNMFLFMEAAPKKIFEHDISFKLSINILYFIYINNDFEIDSKTSKVNENNENENDNNLTKYKRKRVSNKTLNNRDIFLEHIKQSTTTQNNFRIDDIEKKLFRDFVRFIFININKNTKEIKQIIDQDKDKDFWEKLKTKKEYNGYNFGRYSQKLMEFLFEKDEIRELYKIYKEDETLCHWKQVKESKKKHMYDVEFYKKYKKNIDLIYIKKFELNLEENSQDSCDNNIYIKNNNNLNNLLLNNQPIKEEKKFNNNNFEEKKGGKKMLKGLRERKLNSDGFENNDSEVLDVSRGFSGLISSINNSIRNVGENESTIHLFNSISSS